MTPTDKGAILAEALPYLRAFHGKTIVVRFGGRAMADRALKSGFARDVALLRLVGMKVVVVHGGGWGIDELMHKMGLETRRYRGHRITDDLQCDPVVRRRPLRRVRDDGVAVHGGAIEPGHVDIADHFGREHTSSGITERDVLVVEWM